MFLPCSICYTTFDTGSIILGTQLEIEKKKDSPLELSNVRDLYVAITKGL